MRRETLSAALALSVILVAGAALLIAGFQVRKREATPAPVLFPGPVLTQVDGRILPEEYPHSYLDPKTGIELHWRIEPGEGEREGLIYLGLVSPKPGRVEIVLSPAGMMMTGGDVLIGFVKDGELSVRDDYADGPTSNSPDVELGGTDDVLSAAGSPTSEGGTVLELVRALITRDIAFDKPIVRGRMRIRLGNSEFPNFIGLGGDTWTALDVDFFAGQVLAVPSR